MPQKVQTVMIWASSAEAKERLVANVKKQNIIFWGSLSVDIDVPLRPDKIKTKQDMEVISIERSTYEELLTSFNSFGTKMKEMAKWGYDLET